MPRCRTSCRRTRARPRLGMMTMSAFSAPGIAPLMVAWIGTRSACGAGIVALAALVRRRGGDPARHARRRAPRGRRQRAGDRMRALGPESAARTRASRTRPTRRSGRTRCGSDAVLRHQRGHRADPVSRHQPLHEPPVGRGAAAVRRRRARAGPIRCATSVTRRSARSSSSARGVSEPADRPARLRHLGPPHAPCRRRPTTRATG